jgi:hypothetical protein
MNHISYWDNVLDKNVCDDIITRFESNSSQQEQTVMEGHRSFTEINITKNIDDWNDIQNLLIGKMQEYVRKYITAFDIDESCWPQNFALEEFRIKRYLPNDKDEFKFHVDVGDYTSAKRFLAFFWYLNDVVQGGETNFQKSPAARIEYSVTPKAGRLLVFPPLWTHPHVGMKPISGPKYIIGGYLHHV